MAHHSNTQSPYARTPIWSEPSCIRKCLGKFKRSTQTALRSFPQMSPKNLIESEITTVDDLKDELIPSHSHGALSSVINFRDVSSIVNRTLGKQYDIHFASESKLIEARWIVPGKIYRCARPDEASEADHIYLRDTLAIKTIIDLRTPTEHKQQELKYALRIREAKRSPPSTPSSSYSSTTTSYFSFSTSEGINPALRIPGVDYTSINFNGSAYSRHLLSKLPWLSWFHLLYLYVFGRHLDAIAILASTVMRPRGLAGLAIDSLEIGPDAA
jgi:protein-tyrosine phosphatase